MTTKRFWWSVFTVWLVTLVTEWVFHGIWLAPLYQQTAQFWRPWTETQQWIPVMWLGDLAFAWAFVWIYSKGITNTNPWGQAFRYALAIIGVTQIHSLTTVWATTPYPFALVFWWFIAGVTKAMLCAFALTWTYKPWTQWTTGTANR